MKWQRIEDLRIDNDLTQQQVADILCCQREVYRRYEKGTRDIPLEYAIILAQYYEVTLDYLVGLSNCKGIIRRKEQTGYETMKESSDVYQSKSPESKCNFPKELEEGLEG